MSDLEDRIIGQIRASGPMAIADYMALCLLDPDAGYYTTHIPFGEKGDFTTAPEISQMFGELLGLALAQSWLDQGRPPCICLTELGPGRGTLMADALRAMAVVPGLLEAAQIYLIEASPKLRDVQRETLENHDVNWAQNLDALPNDPLFLIANEFFDALPVRQFVRGKRAWCERMVGVVDRRLTLGTAPEAPIASLDHRLADTVVGDVVETCAPAGAIARQIGKRIADCGGVAIIVDYGDWRSKGDTLQAVKNHKTADPLQQPGSADLTAHVDFEALAAAFAPAQVTDMIPQNLLLSRLGIEARAQTLAKSMDEAALNTHHAAFHRLTAVDQMGTLFKAIAAFPRGAPMPAGFAP